MITKEYLDELELQAQYCDDYTQYKREMREINQMRLELDKDRVTIYDRNCPSTRTHLRTKEDVERDSKKAIANALDKMDKLFGYK